LAINGAWALAESWQRATAMVGSGTSTSLGETFRATVGRVHRGRRWSGEHLDPR
jgi:hypothetical protein